MAKKRARRSARKGRPLSRIPAAVPIVLTLVLVAFFVALCDRTVSRNGTTLRNQAGSDAKSPEVETVMIPADEAEGRSVVNGEPGTPEPAAEPLVEAVNATLKTADRDGAVTEIRKRAVKRIAVIIDDVGYNVSQLQAFLDLNLPLTFAVLPGVPHSRDALDMIRTAGREALLHQPMEAEGNFDPGPGAIRLGMTDDEIGRILKANLDGMPGVVGANNHEGSLVSADPGAMATVLEFMKGNGLFYVDSLTTGKSVVEAVAAARKIPVLERDVFLDNLSDRESIMRYARYGLKTADAKGHAVMIGHVWTADLAKTLGEMYPQMVADGYSLSTISEIMIDDASDVDIGN
jgi:polysaccharide deacetylase 2 family uncharacterized protein YibQ